MRTYEQRLKNIRAKAKANKRAKRTIAATLVTMSAIALLIYGTLFAEPLRDADTPTNGPALMQPTQPTHMDAPTEPTDAETPPTAGTRPTQTEPSETTPNDPIGKQVYDITIAGIFNQDIIRKQIQRFNETNEHGILFHVTFEDYNEDQMVDVFANGSANVDIFCFETADTERLIGLKALSALEDDVAAAVSVANVPISVNAVMCNSTLYAYPMSGGQGVAMYYDKSVISEEDTKSIESLLSACEANNRDFAIQLRNAWFLMSFFVSTGCVSEWQVDENGEFVSCYDTFNSEEGMIAARCIQKILNSPSHVDSLNIMNDSGEPAAVLISGAWSYYDAKAVLGDNLGIAAYPSFTVNETKYQMTMSTNFTSLGVRPQEDPVRETALHLLAQYLTGEICQQEQLTEHYLLPTNLAVRESEGNLSDPLYSAIIKQGEYARILGEKHASWWDYTVLIAEEIKNGIDLQSVLEAHQKRVESLIKVYSDAFTVIGTINDDWWRIDLPMQRQVDGKWVTVEAYTMDAGTQFKVRQNEQWQVYYPIEGNFVVEEAGTYFIALDPTTGTITLLEVEQPEPPMDTSDWVWINCVIEGQYMTNKDENVIITQCVYDQYGNLLQFVRLKDGRTIVLDEYAYDERGNILSAPNVNNYQTMYVYDEYGRLVSESWKQNQDEALIRYFYDEIGNLIQKESYTDDVLDTVNTMTYDADGRILTEVKDNINNTYLPDYYHYWEYDLNGDLLSYKIYYGDVLRHVDSFIYDDDGRMTSQRTESDGELTGETTYTYNADGLLIREDRYHQALVAEGSPIVMTNSAVVYAYDKEGNLIQISWYEEDRLSMQENYDVNGNILSRDMGSSRTEWTYDEQGNLIAYDYYYEGTWSRGVRYTYASFLVPPWMAEQILNQQSKYLDYPGNWNGVR